MIPKIIHFCWLSGDPYPESIERCLDSWHRHLPDYDIWLWDTKRFDINRVLWVKEAFDAGKYAFSADYIRLYALYNYGGIYLDSDVIVYKSFDDLLDLPYFLGEDYVHCFEPAIIGAEKGTRWLLDVLDRYEGRHFLKEDGSFDMTGLPVVFHNMLTPAYSFKAIDKKDDFIESDEVINIFPFDWFNSRDYVGARQYARSYCSHEYVGSWMKGQSAWKKRIKRFVPRWVLNMMYSIMYKLGGKKNLHLIQIPYISD
jgi:hypothetical protein